MSKKGSLRYSSIEAMPPGMRALAEAKTKAAASPADAPGWVPGKLGARARHAQHTPGEMNKTEARYAQQLDALKAAGEVLWWGFEVVKLRLAKRAWLTVDFLVQMADGSFELHEVKGRKGNRYFATEDGKLKAKFAAVTYPFWPFRIVWPAKGGGWDQELQR